MERSLPITFQYYMLATYFRGTTKGELGVCGTGGSRLGSLSVRKKGAGLSSRALGSPAGPQPREEREPAAVPAMVAGEWGGSLGNPGNGGSAPTADQPLTAILVMTAVSLPKQACQRHHFPSP